MIQVKGLRETRKALEQVDKELAKELVRAGRRSARAVATGAKARAPKHSGNLARSIRVRASANKASVVAGNDRVPYAAVTEFGGTIPTRDRKRRRPHPQQPFLYPAINALREEISQNYEREVAEVVRKAGF